MHEQRYLCMNNAMNRLNNISFRQWNLALVLAVLALLAFALYAQHGLLLEPCPLCILQRVAFVWMGLVALLAAVHNAAGFWRWVYVSLISAGGVAGMLVAGRHLWLQSLPADKVPECGPGLNYMLENFPLAEVWENVLYGSGSCAELGWQFLGLSMPGWTLLWYVILTAGTLYFFTNRKGA